MKYDSVTNTPIPHLTLYAILYNNNCQKQVKMLKNIDKSDMAKMQDKNLQVTIGSAHYSPGNV